MNLFWALVLLHICKLLLPLLLSFSRVPGRMSFDTVTVGHSRITNQDKCPTTTTTVDSSIYLLLCIIQIGYGEFALHIYPRIHNNI